MQKQQIICRVLTGPTASGKTGISIKLAEKYGYQIICMDSMQIYRKMNIGTAKPTLQERRGIPHHLIDILEPDEPFSVQSYRQLAEKKIIQITERGHKFLFVGGTGLYLNALMHPMAMGMVSADESLRKKLRANTDTIEGRNALHDYLRRIDPVTADKLPINDVRRVIRAIEVTLLTGIPFSKQPERKMESQFSWRVASLQPERQRLYRKIDLRVDEMMQAGLEKEVRNLLQSGISEDAQSMKGLGYKELVPYIHGNIDLERAVYGIKLGTRHYAKRQITFMKREENISYFDPDDPRSWDEISCFFERNEME